MNELVLLGGLVSLLAYQGVFFAARVVAVFFGVEVNDVGGLAIGGGITAALACVAVAFLRRTREQDQRSTEQSDNYVAWADKRLAFEERRANEALERVDKLEAQLVQQSRDHLRELADKDQIIIRLQRVNNEQTGVIQMLTNNQRAFVRDIEESELGDGKA